MGLKHRLSQHLIATQARLPAGKWIASIGELKGIAMKMGQILSYIDVAMPQPVQHALSVLQTHAQAMDTEQVRAVVRSVAQRRSSWLINAACG